MEIAIKSIVNQGIFYQSANDVVDDIGGSFKKIKLAISKYPNVFSFIKDDEHGWVLAIDLSLLELLLGKSTPTV